MVAREDFIDKHADVIQAFVDGWFEGAIKAKKDQQYCAELLMLNEPLYKELGVETTLNNLIKVDLVGIEENINMFVGRDTEPLFNSLFREAGKVWLSRGFIGDTINPNFAMTDQFLKKYMTN